MAKRQRKVWRHAETGRLYDSEDAYRAGCAPIGRALLVIPIRGFRTAGMIREGVHQLRAHTFDDDRIWSGRSSRGSMTVTVTELEPYTHKGHKDGGTIYKATRALIERLGSV